MQNNLNYNSGRLAKVDTLDLLDRSVFRSKRAQKFQQTSDYGDMGMTFGDKGFFQQLSPKHSSRNEQPRF